MNHQDSDADTDSSLVLSKNLDSEPDFRLLLSNSKYDQIGRELSKMFQYRQKNRKEVHKCVHHHNHHFLERSLFDIEEDLHKILLLLVKQLEIISKRCRQNPSNEESKINESSFTAKNIKPQQNKLSTELKINNILENYAPIKSEYSQLCLENDERFRKKFQKITSQSNPKSLIQHSHYHLNKPDIDYILGSSSYPSKSHSKFVSKEIQLSRLKQHNPLCTTINNLQKISRQTPYQIIKQIQSLIDELHLEHDWISKKLQHYQQQNQIMLSQNRPLSHLADKVNLNNMHTLSEHLIHIMNHLYELHQLNKRHLKSIIGGLQ